MSCCARLQSVLDRCQRFHCLCCLGLRHETLTRDHRCYSQRRLCQPYIILLCINGDVGLKLPLRCRCANVNTSMLGIDEQHERKLRSLLKQAEELSVLRLMSVPSNSLQQTAAGRTGTMESHPRQALRTAWRKILDQLHLSPAQLTTMRNAGNASLEKLRAVYQVLP